MVNLTLTEPIHKALIQTHARECSDSGNVQLILAFVDPNTTIMYYKLTPGLFSLDSQRNERKSARQRIPENEFQNPTTS